MMQSNPVGNNYFRGPFIGYSSQYGKYALGPLMKYQSRMSVVPETFPVGMELEEQWPSYDELRAYEIAHPGVYLTGAVKCWANTYFNRGYGTDAKQRFPSLQVKDIGTLSLHAVVEAEGDANVTYDMYVTKDMNGIPGVGQTIMEIMVMLNPSKSGRAWAQGGTLISSNGPVKIWQRIGGGANVCYVLWDNGPRFDVTVDMRGILMSLRTMGKLTGNEWFNGIGLGIEAISGRSTFRLKSYDVRYGKRDAPLYWPLPS